MNPSMKLQGHTSSVEEQLENKRIGTKAANNSTYTCMYPTTQL